MEETEESKHPKDYNCSFCGVLSSPSRLLIAGPSGPSGKHELFICEDCVDVCVRIFLDNGLFRWILPPEAKATKINKKQKEISLFDSNKDFLNCYNAIFERSISVLLKANTIGLAAVSDEFGGYQYNKNDLFEYGLRLVIDGKEPDLIQNILSNIINLETDNRVKLLKNIMKDAVLMIQQGADAKYLALLLNSYVNIDIETALKDCKKIEKRITKEIRDNYTLKGKKPNHA
jgi:flagellar motor component MotA